MSKLFHNLASLGAAGISQILDAADHLKATRGNKSERPLAGKQVALVFEKASTRTRVSLEVAVSELGGSPIVLSSSGSQMGRGEPIADTARVLGRMAHAIAFRTSDESRLLAMSKYAKVPVLNALTDQS
ncbi:MAG TPA: ornithine carbamoyltransferase, partial [Polyangiaceae bacterium]|nr:ornithine carbamoyltransferase [Polyangiaceae bacterium]